MQLQNYKALVKWNSGGRPLGARCCIARAFPPTPRVNNKRLAEAAKLLGFFGTPNIYVEH